MAFFRAVLYRCCMAMAFMCGIAALTITAAIVANKLPEGPQAWMAAVFFPAVGGATWIAAGAAAPPP